jgi:hypothetical protein
MLRAMTASDYRLWRQYYDTIPDRAEVYLAQLCALIANANFKRPDRRLFQPTDFAPDLRTASERAADDARHIAAHLEVEAMWREAQARYPNGSGE